MMLLGLRGVLHLHGSLPCGLPQWSLHGSDNRKTGFFNGQSMSPCMSSDLTKAALVLSHQQHAIIDRVGAGFSRAKP